ncbi:hypothetical protein RYX36_001544 [Vicia faba]
MNQAISVGSEMKTWTRWVREKEKCKPRDGEDAKLSESSSDESSDESVGDVHFDDSVEGRMKGFDEEIDDMVDASVDVEHRNELVPCVAAPTEPVRNMFITEEIGKQHVSVVLSWNLIDVLLYC